MALRYLHKLFLGIGITLLMLSLYLNLTTILGSYSILTEVMHSDAQRQTWLENNYPTLLLSSNNLNMLDPMLPKQTHHSEMYDEQIGKIDNFNDLKRFVSDEINIKGYKGVEIPIAIDEIVRKKFHHVEAYVSAETNWILKIADYLFPEFIFFQSLDPEDLVKTNHGICNQQSIIFQELIKDYKFDYASVRLSILVPNEELFGHFASAVKVNDEWFYFDTDMEPVYDRKDPLVLKKLLEADKEVLKDLYPQYNFDSLSKEMIVFSDVNSFPAKRGLFFQKATQILSDFSWIIFLIVSFVIRFFLLKSTSH